MRALRRVVAGRDVFSWASDILEGLERLEPTVRPSVPGRVARVARARQDARVSPPRSN